ncbi:MAG: hypothetical protein HKL85_11025 [Acidimicrobiaceae bacterium]|nr:hypothetical protein [Acidimicrobiaceae bacterium]
MSGLQWALVDTVLRPANKSGRCPIRHLCEHLYNPVLFARVVMSADRFTSGRLEVGLGAG